jgi:arylsulfatase A-like enzyme
MTSRPNILFILIDDLGWRDLTCYGSSFYETPNLDRLATEGIRFTDAYAACPVCSPTRASIQTGKYPATVGITDWIDWHGHCHPRKGRLIDVPYVRELPHDDVTIAQALREGGYQTWHVGKWHLGGPDCSPLNHGYEINIGGCDWGCPSRGYFSPWQIPVLPEGAFEGQYLTDHLTDEAIRLIQERDDRPFFLNFCHYAVHTPIQAPAELVAKYEAKAKALGLDAIDSIEVGEPYPYKGNWQGGIKRRRIQSHAVYAAMMENLDWNIGRVLQALEETGQAENTLVVFTSDNGGLATSEGSPTCNAPLAEGKGWMYDGGVREPLLIRWPAGIAPGQLCPTPVTSPDFYPTFLEVAGLPLRPEQHVDGVSFLPFLDGAADFDRGPLFWHYPHYGNQGGTPGCAIRQGDWKLIEFFEDGRLELYNLRADISETRNLVEERSELSHELHAQLVAWRERIEVKIPQPNPDWAPVG